MVKQLVSAGHEVIATARDAAAAAFLGVPVYALDVSQPESIAALATHIDTLDVLINNAGVMDRSALGALTQDELLYHFSVNAVGPVLLAQALLPALLKGQRKVIAHISTKMGSIGDNTSGGSYAYRMSKAALNMGARSMAIDLKNKGVISVALHPGWVQTDMGGPAAPLERTPAIRALLQTIESVTAAQSGGFYNYDGKPLPF